jgi:DNA polymerase-1
MTFPLQQLRSWGLSAVAREGDRITLEPKGLLNDERRDFVRQNRKAILDELRLGPVPPIHYVRTQSDLRVALQVIETANAEILGLDIETYGETLQQHIVKETDGALSLHPGVAPGNNSKNRTTFFKGGLDPRIGQIRSVQIATETEAWVFDLYEIKLDALKHLLESRHFVAYNAVFEHQFLRTAGVAVNLADAMLMDRVLHGVVSDKVPYRSLGTVCSRELGISLNKTLQAEGWGAAGSLSEDQIRYAAMDAVAASRLYPILRARLEITRQWDAYLRLEQGLPTVANLMLNGIRFDTAKCAALTREWEGKLEQAKQVLEAHPGLAGVNLSSANQKDRWLRTVLSEEEISAWPKTAKGNLKTDADTLLDWGGCPDGLVDYLRTESLLKQFRTFLRYVHPLTGRIHAQFQLAGALSGRYGCRAPNLQNPPSGKREARFRELFVAEPGNTLVGADFSQIELRIAAAMAPEPTMKRVFQSGEDLHSLTASKVLGVAANTVSKGQRSLAKALNFGLLYGMGAKGFQEYAKKSYGLKLTLEEASRYRNAFFAAYPGLKGYHQRIAKQLGIDPIVKTRGGLWVDSKKSWTNALNSPIQGTGAEVLNEAVIRLAPLLEGLNARLVHLIHDEILIEVPQENGLKAQEALTTAMVEAFDAMLPEEQLTFGLVEPSIGSSWGALKGS